MKRFKKIYQLEIKKRFIKAGTLSTITVPAAIAVEVKELPCMKTDRPLLLLEELDT